MEDVGSDDNGFFFIHFNEEKVVGYWILSCTLLWSLKKVHKRFINDIVMTVYVNLKDSSDW